MPLTELRKWSTTVYKSKSGTDTTQIPAVGAAITVYRRGATVSTGPVVIDGDGGEAEVFVYDIGAMVVGQQVTVGTSNKAMYVTIINSATSVTLSNLNVLAITVTAGDRLVIRALTDDGDFLGMKLYQDVTGTTVWNRGVPGFVISNTNGFVEFYTTERFFDYIVTGTGLTTTLYRDEESGQSRSRRDFYNVLDYIDVATAIADVPAGATLFFPAGTYTAPTAAGWTISKALTLLGDGEPYVYADATIGTIFRPWTAHQNSTVFTITGDNVIFRNFLVGNASAPASTGTGDGIRIGSASRGAHAATLENLNVINMGRHGLNTNGDALWDVAIGSESGSPTYYACDKLVVNNCDFNGNRGAGLRIAWAANAALNTVWSVGNRLGGFSFANSPGTTLISSGVQDNGLDTPVATWRAQIDMRSCPMSGISGFNCEQFELNSNKNGLAIHNCQGFFVNGADFNCATEVAGTLAISIIGNSRGVHISGWAVAKVAQSINIAAGDKNSGNFIQAPSVIAAPSVTCPATMVIPAETSSVASSSGGNFALLPRTDYNGGIDGMSYIGAIQLPMINGTGAYTGTLKEGLLIWDSSAIGTAKLKYYNGTTWSTVTAVG